MTDDPNILRATVGRHVSVLRTDEEYDRNPALGWHKIVPGTFLVEVDLNRLLSHVGVRAVDSRRQMTTIANGSIVIRFTPD